VTAAKTEIKLVRIRIVGRIIQHLEDDQRDHVGRRDLAAGGSAEDRDQGPGDENREQHREGGAGRTGQFTSEGALKDHSKVIITG
jgi:hypothetical protein